MTDTLIIGGVTYTNVTGLKAKNNNNDQLTFIRPVGTLNISSNGIVDCSEYANASVSVAGTNLLNPPVKAVSGTWTFASAAYTAAIPIDPNIINLSEYQLNLGHIIMLDEYWADYVGDSTYNNRASGLLLFTPKYYYETTLDNIYRTEIFLSSNANGHSWKSGGTFSRDLTNNKLNIQSAGSSWKFIPGVPYRYIFVFFKLVTS